MQRAESSCVPGGRRRRAARRRGARRARGRATAGAPQAAVTASGPPARGKRRRGVGRAHQPHPAAGRARIHLVCGVSVVSVCLRTVCSVMFMCERRSSTLSCSRLSRVSSQYAFSDMCIYFAVCVYMRCAVVNPLQPSATLCSPLPSATLCSRPCLRTSRAYLLRAAHVNAISPDYACLNVVCGPAGRR